MAAYPGTYGGTQLAASSLAIGVYPASQSGAFVRAVQVQAARLSVEYSVTSGLPVVFYRAKTCYAVLEAVTLRLQTRTALADGISAVEWNPDFSTGTVDVIAEQPTNADMRQLNSVYVSSRPALPALRSSATSYLRMATAVLARQVSPLIRVVSAGASGSEM
jgi:hypothetical protein